MDSVDTRLGKHDLVERIEAGFAGDELLRGCQGAVDKDLTARGAVGERDLLVLAKETHLVHAGDGAAAQRVHTDLLGVTRAAHALATVDRMITSLGLGLDHGVEQQLGCAAGGIDLLVVVRLDDLAVKAGQLACGLRYQMTQGCNTDGVIARVHDTGILAQLAQAVHLPSEHR